MTVDDLVKRIVSVLNNEELETLRALCWSERESRFRREDFPLLTQEEVSLVSEGKTIAAIKSYRNRVSVSLWEAKMIVGSEVLPKK